MAQNISNVDTLAIPPTNTVSMENQYFPDLAEDEELEDQGIFEDLSYCELLRFPEFLTNCNSLQCLKLDHNELITFNLPNELSFAKLTTLDLSSNNLKHISNDLLRLTNLKALLLRNNQLENHSLPKDLSALQSLELVNLSGNQLRDFPVQFTELKGLKYLYVGGNQISNIPADIQAMQSLEVLYLGGNQLSEIPAEMGYLHKLTSLILCDNQLQSLPATLIQLRRLESLSLHNNQLQTLPPGIVTLRLVELSLRNNPLVVRFVRELSYQPPSLRELSGRVAVVNRIKYTRDDLPTELLDYLQSYHCCVNPKCRGVYFTARVEHVKFVDFCGKYRLPLMQYLCSPMCSTSTPAYVKSSSGSSSDSEDDEVYRLRKVLLG